MLHTLGRGLGNLLFYLMPRYRKRALSNLSLATSLHLSNQEKKKIAKQSLQNLAITCLEYPKLAYSKHLDQVIRCENPELAYHLIANGQGIIFFCGHQSNWEVLFLDGTQHMPGVAIGRPIKNPVVYTWITAIRERFGGKMVSPREALKEGLKALRQGKFLGIVGDQGMPESGFLSDFLGRRAWTSPAPALLAYKTKSPIIVATTRREKGSYSIHYSPPLWPDLTKPMEEEVPHLMQKALKLFENSILQSPGEWLWQHNRWKQETPKNVYYRYRHDAILVILPTSEEISAIVDTFTAIYPMAFITYALPKGIAYPSTDRDVIVYDQPQDLLLPDYRYKLVFDFTNTPRIKKHFLRLSAFEVIAEKDIRKKAKLHTAHSVDYSLCELVKRALCRPNTLWKN